MAKRAKFVVELQVAYVPMLEEHVQAWRASLSLLLQILKSNHLPCVVQAHWVGRCDAWPQVRATVDMMSE